MKKLFQNLNGYFARRPHSRAALVRLLIYVGFAVAGKLTLDIDLLTTLAIAIVGGAADLYGTDSTNTKTTPVDDPKLGAGKSIPPALEVAAAAVAEYLPAPLEQLFKRYGAEGTWAIVKTAEEAAKHKPTLEEGKAKAGAI